MAKDDVQDWWKLDYKDAASGWGFHWEEDEREEYQRTLFEPSEPYDRIKEFNMAKFLMQKVGRRTCPQDFDGFLVLLSPEQISKICNDC